METAEQDKAENQWEFLGRMAAEMGIYQETLEERIGGLEPEHAAGIANGYVERLIVLDPQRAYDFLDAKWAKMLIRDRNTKTTAALKGLVSIEPRQDRDNEGGRGLLDLIYKHFKQDSQEMTEIAQAAEVHRPRVAAALYDSQKDITRIVALAESVFATNRPLAFELLHGDKYHASRARLASMMLESANLTEEEANIALASLPRPRKDGNTTQYETLTTKSMEVAPFVAFNAALALKQCDERIFAGLYSMARTNLIKRRAAKNAYEVRKCFCETREARYCLGGREEVLTDRDGALELARELQEKGTQTNEPWQLRNAIELFRLVQYTGQELTDAARALHITEKKGRIYGDDRFKLRNSEAIAAGLSMAETMPREAFSLLSGYVTEHAEAREAMHNLSVSLESAGDIESAYCAERRAENPDTDRVSRLRTTLAQQSKEKCPPEFYWENDTEGKKQWFEIHGQNMDLGDRYRFAFELSKDTGDESYVKPLRDEVLDRKPSFARHQFHYAGDKTGMDLLKQRLVAERPALAGHEELMTSLLELVVKEE